MPKFSIIIPVYNVEKYIKKCIDSVFSQSFKDYEVIVVNDGTKDNSMEIVKNYDVKVINEQNKGLSAARNNGVKKATGEYIIFLDSDDYWEKDLLKEINKSLKNKPDLVRFQIRKVFENNKNMINYHEDIFNNLSGNEAFNRIVKYNFIEPAWCYAIKREFYLKNKFNFMENTYHEDFGLIPLIIIKASIVNSIDYIGYNYLQRVNSIMSSNNYDKILKKVNDMYCHYKYLIKEINKLNINNKVLKSYISNIFIEKITTLNKQDYKKYKKILKEEKVYDNLLNDTLTRKIKKLILKLSPKFYYKLKEGKI